MRSSRGRLWCCPNLVVAPPSWRPRCRLEAGVTGQIRTLPRAWCGHLARCGWSVPVPNAGNMPAPRLGSSRQRVVFRPCPAPEVLSFVFVKCSVFCSVWGAKRVVLRAKRAKFAAFKTVTSFVIKYFLASFPLFSIFRSALLIRCPGGISLPPECRHVPAPGYDKLSRI